MLFAIDEQHHLLHTLFVASQANRPSPVSCYGAQLQLQRFRPCPGAQAWPRITRASGSPAAASGLLRLHQASNKSSVFAPYLRTLPRSCGHALLLSETEFEKLGDTARGRFSATSSARTHVTWEAIRPRNTGT